MKILFITDNFPPETNAPAIRTFEHSKIWANKGHSITIITCFPNFPKGKVFTGYKNKLYAVEVIDGIRVIRVWSYISSNSRFLKRSIDFFSFALTSFVGGIFVKSDIIIATSPQFFTTWSAFLLSKVKQRPWVFELRDLWPETIKAVGSIDDGFIYQLLEKIEIGLYKSAKIIIPVTNSFKRNLVLRGINEQKINVITNGIDKNIFSKQLLSKATLNQEKYVFGYVGTHGVCQRLQFILNVVNNNNLTEYEFKFVGDGADKKDLVEYKKKNNLNNVFFEDSITKDQVGDVLLSCNAVFVPLRNSKTFETVIPSKIFEAAYLKVPIILGVRGEAKAIVEKYQLGVCYEPEDESSFLKAIENVKKFTYDESLYDQFIAKFSRKNLANEMLNHLQKVI